MAVFNATLIAQMINFGIAYLIISKFLVIPALAIIMQEDKEKNILNKQAEQQHNRLQEKQRQRHELLQRFRTFCASHFPYPSSTLKPHDSILHSSRNFPLLSKEELGNLKNQLSSLVLTKIRGHDEL